MESLFTGYILPLIMLSLIVLIVLVVYLRIRSYGGPVAEFLRFFAVAFVPSLVYAAAADESSGALFGAAVRGCGGRCCPLAGIFGRARMKDVLKTIGNLIDKQGVAFIGSVDEDGFPNTKAMLPPRKREGIKVFYFTTNTSSMRVRQYAENPKACVYFCDRRFFRGVMLKGRMDVLEDAVSKGMIWREGDDVYYPGGVGDPDYCVLRFTAENGRFYSNFNSKNFSVDCQQ